MSNRFRSAQLLRKWLESNGSYVSNKIGINQHINGQLSLKALKPIDEAEILVSIPEKLCLESARDDYLNLAQNLVRERILGAKSNFYHYIDVLPTDISSFPRTWSTDMWKDIENTSVFHTHLQQSLPNEEENVRFCESTGIAPLSFLWADCMSTSRCFQVKNRTVLIPFVDLCNHDDMMVDCPIGDLGCIVLHGESIVNRGVNSYNLVSTCPIPAGAELYTAYGDLPFEDKVCLFGWIDKKTSPEKYHTIRLSLPLLLMYETYGKPKYRNFICQFEGKNDELVFDIYLFLEEHKFTRVQFLRALKRRLRELNNILSDCRPSASSSSRSLPTAPSSSTALIIHPSPTSTQEDEHQSRVKAIIDFEIAKINYILAIASDDQAYEKYRTGKEGMQKQIDEQDLIGMQQTEMFSLLLKRETGLDLMDEVYDEDEDPPPSSSSVDMATTMDEREREFALDPKARPSTLPLSLRKLF